MTDEVKFDRRRETISVEDLERLDLLFTVAKHIIDHGDAYTNIKSAIGRELAKADEHYGKVMAKIREEDEKAQREAAPPRPRTVSRVEMEEQLRIEQAERREAQANNPNRIAAEEPPVQRNEDVGVPDPNRGEERRV